MIIKWFGAALIVTGCGGFGVSMAAAARQEERQLVQLLHALELMESELQYRLTPLPELCAMAARETGGCMSRLFRQLSDLMARCSHSDVRSCMHDALGSQEGLSRRIRRHLQYLGKSLGRFDLPGQLQGIRAVRNACEADVQALRSNREVRLRSYQTLSLCAGAALVILFV